ncbi:MAG: hypothetical protein EOM20_02140 [Spartobacteria bacterium]|nr:hypothetical protein [Spartobacteria bacterium]
MRATWIILLLLVILAGCLPIELSVSPNGQKVLIPRQEGYFSYDFGYEKIRLLYAPPEGKPAFALYAPDEKSILTASQVGSGMMRGVGFKLSIIGLKDKETNIKDLFDVTNLTYLQWSRDKQYISYTRISDSITPPMEENLPELYVVKIEGVNRRKIDANNSILHRWFSNSEALLAIRLTAKTNDMYQGALVKYDLSDKGSEPEVLAELICGNNMFLDLSPDDNVALLTAFHAVPTGQSPILPELSQPKQELYRIDIKEKTVTPSNREARYALFSPKGDRILVGAGQEDRADIDITDLSFSSYKRMATDAAVAVGESFTDSTSIYPCWVNNDTFLYLAKHAVYGTAGANLQLVEMNVKTGDAKNLQATIDRGVNETHR